MNFAETIKKQDKFSVDQEYLKQQADEFLAHAQPYLHKALYSQIINYHQHERSPEIISTVSTIAPGRKVVTYDKYAGFMVDGVPATAGQIIAARHLDPTITVPEELDKSGLGKKLRKAYLEKAVTDELYDNINYELAGYLANASANRNLSKSEGYKSMRSRLEAGSSNEQLGVIAESIMQGFAEMISVDRPDLGISVSPSNAYQDMEEKVDFVITTTTKRRGAGVEVVDPLVEEKHIGIQFTMNTAKEAHKKEQIERSKEKGTDFDDIVYVAVDAKTLAIAIRNWEKKGKPLSGVWGELSKPAQTEVIKGLFHTLLSEEQEKSLLKSFE